MAGKTLTASHYAHGYTTVGWLKLVLLVPVYGIFALAAFFCDICTTQSIVFAPFKGYTLVMPWEVFHQPVLLYQQFFPPTGGPIERFTLVQWVAYSIGWMLAAVWLSIGMPLARVFHSAHVRTNGGKPNDPSLGGMALLLYRVHTVGPWVAFVLSILSTFGWLSRAWNVFQAGWFGLPIGIHFPAGFLIAAVFALLVAVSEVAFPALALASLEELVARIVERVKQFFKKGP